MTGQIQHPFDSMHTYFNRIGYIQRLHNTTSYIHIMPIRFIPHKLIELGQ